MASTVRSMGSATGTSYAGGDGASSYGGDATTAFAGAGAGTALPSGAASAAASAYGEEPKGVLGHAKAGWANFKKGWRNKGPPKQEYRPFGITETAAASTAGPNMVGKGGGSQASASTGETEDASTFSAGIHRWAVDTGEVDSDTEDPIIIEPPEDHKNPQQWHFHTRMLLKAGYRADHANQGDLLKKQRDLHKISTKRLPKFPRATTEFVEFKPKPKDEVLAIIIDSVSRPRNFGQPCTHGDDQPPTFVLRDPGWKPSEGIADMSGHADNVEWRIEERWDRREDRLWRVRVAEEKERRRFTLVPLPEDPAGDDGSGGSPSTAATRTTRGPGAFDKVKNRGKEPREKPVIRGAKRSMKFRERTFDEEAEMRSHDSDDGADAEQVMLKIKEPPANVTLYHGEKYQIEWLNRDKLVMRVVIKLFDLDHMVHVISPSALNNGFWLWVVPAWVPPGSHYRIKVEDEDDVGNFSFSAAFFQVAEPVEPAPARERRLEQLRRHHFRMMNKERARNMLKPLPPEAMAGMRLIPEDDPVPVAESLLGDPNDYQAYTGERDKAGRPHGKGKYSFAVGGFYEGTWKHGIRDGAGISKMNLGPAYQGEWKDDQPHGHGEMKFLNGTVYVGQWQKGKRHGAGTYTYPTGRVYKGEFQDGYPHGQGIMKSPCGAIYAGRWEGGRCCGHGKLYFERGKEMFNEVWEPRTFSRLIRFVKKRKIQQLHESNRRHRELHGVKEDLEFEEYLYRVRAHNKEVAEAEALQAKIELLRKRKLKAAQRLAAKGGGLR